MRVRRRRRADGYAVDLGGDGRPVAGDVDRFAGVGSGDLEDAVVQFRGRREQPAGFERFDVDGVTSHDADLRDLRVAAHPGDTSLVPRAGGFLPRRDGNLWMGEKRRTQRRRDTEAGRERIPKKGFGLSSLNSASLRLRV